MMTGGIKKFVCLLLAFVSLQAVAADVSSTMDKAAGLYKKGDYAGAVTLYNDIIKQEGTSVEVLYNLGNSYMKAGNPGMAVVCYERALRLDPGNSAVKANLAYIASKVADSNTADAKGKKVSVVPDQLSFFGQVKHNLLKEHSSNGYAVVAVVAFLLLVGCISVYLFMDNVLLRKIGFFGGMASLGISILFVILAVFSAKAYYEADQAVVKTYKIKLLQEPSNDAKTNAYPLNTGTLLEVVEVEQDETENATGWVKVRLNSDYIGWVRQEDIEII